MKQEREASGAVLSRLCSRSMREITLRTADVEPYEIGAAVTVLMCWPSAREEAKRMEQHARLCAWAVRKLGADEPGGELRPWAINPLYAFPPT